MKVMVGSICCECSAVHDLPNDSRWVEHVEQQRGADALPPYMTQARHNTSTGSARLDCNSAVRPMLLVLRFLQPDPSNPTIL